jgi:hypothetical protein
LHALSRILSSGDSVASRYKFANISCCTRR